MVSPKFVEIIVVGCALLSAPPAFAAQVTSSGVVVGQGAANGTPVAEAAPAPHLEAGGQNYDLSVSGILAMCETTPALCAMPAQQQTLEVLRNRRTVGFALGIGGIGLMIAGPVASLAVNCHRGGRCEPDWVVTGASLGGGAVFSLIGALIAPSQRELISFIDDANANQSVLPVHIEFTGVGGSTPGVLVVGNL